MTHPVTSTAKYIHFGSDRKLAKALIDATGSIDWRCQPPALAGRIGDLNRGVVTWWRSRPEQTQALADILEVPVEDLGVMDGAASFIVNFSDFPALKPLDMKREKPWQLGREVLDISEVKSEYGVETLDEWLDPNPASWRPPFEQAWLQVDSPIEQQLLTQKLTAAGRFDVVSAQTLIDTAEQLRGGKPLVVSVSESGGDADWLALADRPYSAGLLVIAPFHMPIAAGTWAAASFYSWERLTSNQRDLRKTELTQPSSPGGFKRWTWTLLPDWRVKLLDWVGARLDRHHPDSLFSADAAQKWLANFDPQSVWFSTPSDLLQLCQLMNSRNLPKFTDKDCGMKLATALFKAGPAYRREQMAELVQTRWYRRDIPWRGSLPMQVWLSLSPDALVAVSPAALAKISTGKNLAAVKKELATLGEYAKLGNPDALLTSGLIQPDSDDAYDFQYRTLAGLLVRDKLLRQVANEAAESWGWACFDEQRRPLVDAVLDAVSLDQLVAALQRACGGAADGDASASLVGAREALFMAVGRRIAGGDAINAADVLPLARCVIAQLDMASLPWALPGPCSRPTQTDDDSLQWITACWAWSLLPNESAPDDSWLFPGWCQALPEAPYWVNVLWVDEKYEPASPAWLQFLLVIDAWLKEIDTPVADAPPHLHIALLARAAAGRWSPDLSWWATVSKCFWAQDALIKRLEDLGKSDAPQVALRLWPSWLAFERSFPAAENWILTISKIRHWLLANIQPVAALDGLNDDDLWYLVGAPVYLPPDFRPLLFKKITPLLFVALEQNAETIPYFHEVQFFERFGVCIAPLLHDFLAHERLGVAAATCLWRWDAESASQHLQHSQHLDALARQHLLMECPATYLAVAANVVKTSPELFDLPSLDGWARQQLPNAGASAPALLAVLRAAQAANDNWG